MICTIPVRIWDKGRGFPMKKLLAIWLSLALLLCCAPLALAEPQIEVGAAYDRTSGLLTLTWDAAAMEGYKVAGVKVDGAEIPDVKAEEERGQATATVSGLAAGEHKAEVLFSLEGGGEALPAAVSFRVASLEEELASLFKEDTSKRRYDSKAGTLTVHWNQSDMPQDVTLTGIRIGNANYGLKSPSENGVAVINGLSDSLIRIGDTAFSFVFQLPDSKTAAISAEPLHRGGTLKTELALTVVNGYVQATLKDEYGRPLAGHDVYIKLDSTIYGPQKTGQNGVVLFEYFPVPEDRNRVMCLTEGHTDGDIIYVATAKGFLDIIVPPPTTTPTTETTSSGGGTTQTTLPADTTTLPPLYTTTLPTELPHTTYSLLGGAGTTGMIGSFIAVNARYDARVVSNFQLANSDFDSRARLLLTPETYALFVGDSTSALMLAVRNSPYGVTEDQVGAAILGISKYSTYDTAHIGVVTVDLSVLLADSAANTETFLNPADGSYTIHLPVPASMSAVPLFAVAAVDGSGLHDLTDATVQDGYISFTVDRMGSYAILGFAEEGQTKPKNDIPVPLLIIIIVGVLLLVAAGLLLFFFVLRRPRDPDDDLPPDDDLFSGDDWPTGGGLTMLTDAPSPGDFSPDGQPGDVPGDTLPLVPLSGDGQPAVPLKPTAPSTPVQPEEKTGRNAPVDGNDRDIYSSDSKRPSAPAADVSLGSFEEPQRPKKKNPSDYDIDL